MSTYTYEADKVYFLADEHNDWEDTLSTVFRWVDRNGKPLEEIKPIRPNQHPIDTERRLSFQ